MRVLVKRILCRGNNNHAVSTFPCDGLALGRTSLYGSGHARKGAPARDWDDNRRTRHPRASDLMLTRAVRQTRLQPPVFSSQRSFVRGGGYDAPPFGPAVSGRTPSVNVGPIPLRSFVGVGRYPKPENITLGQSRMSPHCRQRSKFERISHGGFKMSQRLVDVLNGSGAVLHTYPITLGELGDAVDDKAYIWKALDAAALGRLVPEDEVDGLTARMHVSRGGQMSAYGDNVKQNSETKVGLEQSIREDAYALWEQDGRPEGRTELYWHRALDQHLNARAYALWQREGCPDGRAEEFWFRVVNFESQ